MTIGLAIADRFPAINSRVKDIVLVISGSILIALSAQIAFYLPISPVPITGQTFAILLIGFALGWKRGAAAVMLYFLEGLAGMPVFASGGAGLGWLLGPTGGYLLGFVGAASLTGFLAEKGFDKKAVLTLAAFIAGQAVIYLFGAAWLSVFTGLETAIQTGIMPFLIGDGLKAILAALALPFAWKLID